MVKHLPTTRETQVRSLGRKDLLEKEMATVLQYSCLEKSHGRRMLEGYSPWGHKVESVQCDKLIRYIL